MVAIFTTAISINMADLDAASVVVAVAASVDVDDAHTHITKFIDAKVVAAAACQGHFKRFFLLYFAFLFVLRRLINNFYALPILVDFRQLI